MRQLGPGTLADGCWLYSPVFICRRCGQQGTHNGSRKTKTGARVCGKCAIDMGLPERRPR